MDYFTRRKLLHLLFPNRCPVCSEIINANDTFCGECADKITPCTENFSIEGASGTAAVYVYDERISPAVILMKNGTCGNADFAFGTALAEKLRKCGFTEDTDFIVPVPMHPKDRRRRGYNQAELISHQLERILHIPCRTDIAVKNKLTSAQKELGKAEREKNLRGAFSVSSSRDVKGKRLLIVDDVCTTGSTLAELTSVLLDAGAERVYCAVCCKTLQLTHEQ